MYSFGNRYFIRFGAVVAKFYDSTKKEIWISSPNWVAVINMKIYVRWSPVKHKLGHWKSRCRLVPIESVGTSLETNQRVFIQTN